VDDRAMQKDRAKLAKAYCSPERYAGLAGAPLPALVAARGETMRAARANADSLRE